MEESEKVPTTEDLIRNALIGPDHHAAWPLFLQTNFPATKHEDPEYLTLGEVMERLNEIAFSDYKESKLLTDLQKAGFKQLTPPPAGLFLWMIKSTSMPMISEESENSELLVLNPEPLHSVRKLE